MKKYLVFGSIMAGILLGCHVKKEAYKDSSKTYEPTWESLQTAPVPDWFRDGKFGIFIHWGAYSVIGHRKNGRGYAEHVPKALYRDAEYYYPYLEQRFGSHPPELGYKDIIKMFKAEHWDPDQWSDLFYDAGAKYVVLTAEHHDGYALWDSDLTDWCATKVGPMRDLVGDLEKAVRSKGLKYSTSYHRERHPGYFAIMFEGERFSEHNIPHPDIAEEIIHHPHAAQLYGPFTYSDEFIDDYMARWKELQKKYKPDFMWIDGIPIFQYVEQTPQTRKFHNAFKQLIADYFNAAEGWNKQVYLNNKGGLYPNWPLGLGVREKDNLTLNEISESVWQNPATMGTSYGYMASEEKQDAYKSTTQLIHLLIDVVSKNGNLLLNIGPRADGTIPEGMRERLLAIGEWLSENGESIYGTRPWKSYGEGPENPATSESFRFTQSKDGKTVYAIQLTWGVDGNIIIEKLGQQAGLLDGEIKNVSLIGSQADVTWERTSEGLNIKTNAQRPNNQACVWKIELQ